jgi:hypothetical protein
MKLYSLAVNLLLGTGLVLLACSCQDKTGDEIKVPDFKSLQSQFREPPAEYTTAPFFVWNADITAEEIDSFMVGFKNQGSRQVFVHPRPGLITEYLSDKWFELFRHTVDKGKELGMKVWIYDENSYPSGFAGGHVPAEMPESYNQGQGLRMIKFESLPDTAEKFFLVLREENGSYSDITATAVSEKGKQGRYLAFFKTCHGKSDWYGGFPYVDLLHNGVTRKFMERTMSGYEKYAGSEFGVTIPGTFTDEPHISSPGGIRYTPDLFREFEDKWGYDLKICLPSLFEEVGDWKKVRHNYTQVLLDMFIERWAKPWYEYCESKGLKFTGHYWEHEWPNMRMGGDNMGMYIYHQVPAVDMLFNQFDDSTAGAQFGNVRAIRELASAANQAGRVRKLSETYGGSGWDLTFTEMKRNGDWEYALGVNLMNQHLTYFTMAGARKYDYPPSFDYHEPWWNDYKYINDHYARLSLALSAGRQVNDILVLEPTTTCWMYDSYVARNKNTGEIGQSFQTFITTLEKKQVEYDLGSESILEEMGSVSGGKLICGNAGYSRVIIPPNTENLNSATFSLIKKFVSKGGSLIIFSSPSLLDGIPNNYVRDFFNDQSGKINKAGSLNEEFISQYLGNNNTEFSDLKGGQLYHQTRILEDGRLVFLVNSSLSENAAGSISVPGSAAIELNTITGELYGYPAEQSGGSLNISFDIPPAGSLLLYVSSSPAEAPAIPVKPSVYTKLPPAGPIKVSRNEDNALTIDFCDITTGEKTMNDLHVFSASDMVYRLFGFRNGNPWNHSVQYRTNIIDRDTFGINTSYTASYHFTVKGRIDVASMKAVVERPWLGKVTVNGNPVSPEEGKWWLDRSFGVFKIDSLVREGDNILAFTVSPMKIHAEVEPVYITGDFSVEPVSKGWIITPPVKELKPGSWLGQGLPFYSWGMTYSQEFIVDSPAGAYVVVADDWKGTVCEIMVNGKDAGWIAFPPYRADITSLISPGVNRIDLKVIGSLRNLQGPHHNNPPTGLASPWNWRNVKNYPKGSDYVLYNYGLMKEFELVNGK